MGCVSVRIVSRFMSSWFLSWRGVGGIYYLFQMPLKSRKPGFSSLWVSAYETLHVLYTKSPQCMTQFCLVFLPLLIQHKAVLLTFKNKGVFLDVNPQKCLLRGTCVLFFCWFGGHVHVIWGPYFLFLWIGSFALPVIHVPSAAQYCSVFKMCSNHAFYLRD